MTIDWTSFLAVLSLLCAVLARLFGLSLLVQLALESLYRWDGFVRLEVLCKARLGFGIRFPVAMTLSLFLCHELAYDALAQLFPNPEQTRHWTGWIITAMAVTGGTAPFLAAMNKIEAMKERAKTATVMAVAARNGGGGA